MACIFPLFFTACLGRKSINYLRSFKCFKCHKYNFFFVIPTARVGRHHFDRLRQSRQGIGQYGGNICRLPIFLSLSFILFLSFIFSLFSQLVWDDTTSIGCAKAVKESGNMAGTFVVCQYSPPGNWGGVNPKHVHPPKQGMDPKTVATNLLNDSRQWARGYACESPGAGCSLYMDWLKKVIFHIFAGIFHKYWTFNDSKQVGSSNTAFFLIEWYTLSVVILLWFRCITWNDGLSIEINMLIKWDFRNTNIQRF